jgi:AraC-like DNA-binding protein
MGATDAAPLVDGAVGCPAVSLRSFVDQYTGSRLERLAPGSHQGLPSGYLTLIIGLGVPIDIAAMPNAAQPPAVFDAFVGGLHTSPATVRYGTAMRCMSVRLSPLGARALLGMPASELVSTVVDLRDVMRGSAVELLERLNAADTWHDRFAALDVVLSRIAADRAQTPPAVAWAWRRLAASAGTLRVEALAEELGWSRRHLSDRFRTEFGVSPKVAARLLRFEHACRLLQARPRASLADAAVSCGYYDQAHMTREWGELAGSSPAAWLAAEELPNVLDADASPASPCGHDDIPLSAD